MSDMPVEELCPNTKAVDASGKFMDPTKQLLQWLYKSKSSRLTLRNNVKGKNRYVWRQFRLAFVDDIEQPYAMCCECRTFVKYSGRTGTGGLVRHNCFRQNIAAIDYIEERKADAESKKAIAPSTSRLQVEELVQQNSTRIGYIPNYKGKSGVWSQFDIITVDGKSVNFAACKLCHSIVSYVSRTGTGSMTRHKCQKVRRNCTDQVFAEELAKRVKQEHIEEYGEPSTPPSADSPQPPMESNLADLHLKAFSQILQVNLQNFGDKQETPKRSPPCEAPEETLQRQYLGMVRRSLDVFHALQTDVFFDLAQTFVNVGAEYGKIDIRQVLLHTAGLEDLFNLRNN